jgi:threonylcarbamoyladenosine tRNA methylthiotransferase MtaB
MIETVLVERDGLGRTEQFVPIAVPGHGPGQIVAARVTGTSPDGLVGEPIRTAA